MSLSCGEVKEKRAKKEVSVMVSEQSIPYLGVQLAIIVQNQTLNQTNNPCLGR